MARAGDRRSVGAWAGAAALVAVVAVLSNGCVRGCHSGRPPIHINPNMDYQEKYEAQEASDFFYDGMSMRQPVAGTVARGELRAEAAFYTGKSADGSFIPTSPVEPDQATLARGEQRYGIYCAPCHTDRGDGKGILFDRGVATANLHDERIRAMPDGEMYDVITAGKGLMPGYAYPVHPADRWAIIAWVRVLQQRQLAKESR